MGILIRSLEFFKLIDLKLKPRFFLGQRARLGGIIPKIFLNGEMSEFVYAAFFLSEVKANLVGR